MAREVTSTRLASSGEPDWLLIVDDDPKLREHIRVHLEMEGYSVKEAGSADEGLSVLDESTPDLVHQTRQLLPT